MQKKTNQAVTMSPIFFDPAYKVACFENKNGKATIHYEDDEWGVRLEDNGDVSFAMKAPEAKSVCVAGISGSMSNEKIELTKCKDGYFRKRVSGIVPGFHYHNWFVDGAKVVNPIAPIAYGCFGATNFFEIPESQDSFWLLKDVPHGDVEIRSYVSNENHHVKQCYVYTPPFYRRDTQKRYPVLYIQHGVGEDETGWIWNGKLNLILDNLLAAGKCSEMIVVVGCGYSFRDNENPVFYPGDFGNELVSSCIPYIEKHYRTRKGRENRAMAGLSLGSAQAIQIVSRFQHLFAHLGVFSGVRDDCLDRILAQQEEYPMQTVFMTAGKGEKGLAESQCVYTDQFAKLGVTSEQTSYTGYHEWHVWRESLRDFAQMIFTEQKEESDEKFFPYEEELLPVDRLDCQTYASHLLMFDPIHKGLIFDFDEKGRPNGRYKDEYAGYKLLDVNSGRIRFYYRSENAGKVELNIWGMDATAMQKIDDQWWSVEVEGVEKGLHYYNYFVNGTEVVDGNGQVGYGGFGSVNYFEMPENDFEEYKLRQVPHGTVHMNYFTSDITGRKKLCYVYTPAGYDEQQEKRYPVLYLQHGGGENEIGWIWQGKAANIADNLIASGRMQEMIIVMNTGYAFPEDREYDPGQTAFVDELCGCCVAFIDSTYRTMADSSHRAVAGLSMGAMQAQTVALAHPEVFSYVGIFSGMLNIVSDDADYSDILLNPEEFAKRYQVFFAAIGTKEPFYPIAKANMEQILAAGCPLQVYEDYGYHDWTFWRHCMREFLPKLFR